VRCASNHAKVRRGAQDSDDDAPLQSLVVSGLADAEDSDDDQDQLFGDLFGDAPVNASFLESDVDEDISGNDDNDSVLSTIV
jgi:hypothetical protein